MPLYFPLHPGDTWKYAESVAGVESPYLTVRTVLPNPETIDGRQVFAIRETFEPARAGTFPAPTGGVFVK